MNQNSLSGLDLEKFSSLQGSKSFCNTITPIATIERPFPNRRFVPLSEVGRSFDRAIMLIRSSKALAFFRLPSHGLRLVKHADLARGKAEFPEHGIGMLVEFRRRRRKMRGCARQRHRLADET